MRSKLPAILVFLVSTLLLAGFFFKDSLYNLFKTLEHTNNAPYSQGSQEYYTDSVFNYLTLNQPYKLTFIEFGSTFCSECKKMETVLELIRTAYPEKVNVVFVNVNQRNNRKIASIFGIRLIPVQIILNREGSEIFRHQGYFSFNEASILINRELSNL